jgi:4-amino-4-deoxy-L-arabinose transferase-like glycosyltransferase
VPVAQIKSFRAQSLLIQGSGIFLVAAGFLIALAPSAPFSKELGVCESGAVRDVLAGNIILPRFLPGPIVHVPPLYWWIAALCVKGLGWNELALRLPSLVAAALTCAIVFAWSSRTLGRQVGFWSAAALLLCHFFLDAARQARMDSMLALFVTAAAACLERAIYKPAATLVEPKTAPADGFARYASKKQASPVSPTLSRNTEAMPASVSQHPTSSYQTWYFVAAAGAIGLGTLTKGILGIVLPGLIVALFLLIRGRLRELFRLHLVTTFIAGLAIGLTWFIAAYRLGGRPFLEWQVQMNLWSRFIPAGAGGAEYCAHPFWYFVPHILSGFLPWSLYLPAFASAVWSSAGRRLPEPLVYALCWFAALLIFFSSSNGKCLVYILPAFSPLAILAGWTTVEAQVGFGQRRRGNQFFAIGSIFIAIGTLVIVFAAITVIGYGVPAKLGPRLHPTDRRFLELLLRQGYSLPLLIWAAFSIVGCGLAIGGCVRATPKLETVGTLLIAGAGGWFWFAVMNPALARGETLKTFVRQAALLVPAGDHIGHFGLGDCELNFYSPRPLEPISQISCPRQNTALQYIIIRQDDLNAMPIARRACFTVELQATPNDSIGPRLLIRRTGQ